MVTRFLFNYFELYFEGPVVADEGATTVAQEAEADPVGGGTRVHEAEVLTEEADDLDSKRLLI